MIILSWVLAGKKENLRVLSHVKDERGMKRTSDYRFELAKAQRRFWGRLSHSHRGFSPLAEFR
jgi:hypothetical protein